MRTNTELKKDYADYEPTMSRPGNARKMRTSPLLIAILVSGAASAGNLFDGPHDAAVINCIGLQEKHIIAAHCQGKTEVNLGDLGRADCVDDIAVYEYGWSETWKSDIGQILSYGRAFPEKRMILRLIASNSWESILHLTRANGLIEAYGLPIETRNFVCANGEALEAKRWFKRKNPTEFPKTEKPPYYKRPGGDWSYSG